MAILSDYNGDSTFTIGGNSFEDTNIGGGTPVFSRVGSGGSVLNVTTSQGVIDKATAAKSNKYYLSPEIYDLTSWDVAETDNTKRKNLQIDASGITHDSRASSSPNWQPGGIFNVRIYMTKFLLRAGRFGHPSSPPAHFSVAFQNFGTNSHGSALASTSSNDVNYLANWIVYSPYGNNRPTPSSLYSPTGATGTFDIASVYHAESTGGPSANIDNFAVFQINGKLHIGLCTLMQSTDVTGDIEYAARVTELC